MKVTVEEVLSTNRVLLHADKYSLIVLSINEARDLAFQLSRAAAIAEAQNRARAKEPVTS